jgi:hypothetical protein
MRGTPGNRAGHGRVRRWLPAGGVAGVTLIIAAGCGGGTGRSTAAAGGTPAPSTPAASATPSAGASAASADPTAGDTQRVCGAIFQTVTEGTSAVGADLGAMVGHLSGANQSAAGASRDSALHRLSELASHVRSTAAPALDAGVRSAADQTASRLESLAADPNLLAGVQGTDQVTPVIAKITGAADPLTTACS